jgi:hypothetical protein
MITEFEKFIYNEHLKISRSSRNKPFRFRQNFDDIESTTEVYLKKLALFFNKFKNIKPSEFFSAPYKLYEDTQYFGLDFFCTQKAVKAYSVHIKSLMSADPDDDEMLKRIADGLVFIKNFLKENKIKLGEYTQYMNDTLPWCILHMKENRFPFYILYELPLFEKKFQEIDKYVLQFMFGDSIFYTIDLFRTKYLASKKAKVLIQKGLQKIQN